MTGVSVADLAPGGFLLPERMPIVEWAATRHEMPADSALPGPFVPFPFQAEILRAFDDQAVTQITIATASQVGKSAVAGVMLHHATTHDPGPTIWLLPDIPVRNRWVATSLRPMVEECPHWRRELRSGKRSIGLERARFRRATAHFLIPTTSRMAQLSARYIFADEFDKLPERTEGESEPIDQLRARMRWFPNGKLVIVSSPREAPSPVWAELGASDWREVFVTCPHCGKPFWWDFRRVAKWQERPDGMSQEEHSLAIRTGQMECWFECPECHGRIEESQREALNRAQFCAYTRKGEPGHAGFHVPSLAGPKASLPKLVAQFLAAQAELAAGEDGKMRHFVQHELGEPYQAKISSSDEKTIAELATGPRRGVVPDLGPGSFVTLGIDVQRDGVFWAAVAGNAESARYALVDWGEMLGEVEDIDFQDRLFRELHEREWPRSAGAPCKMSLAFMDSGDGFMTGFVYSLCQRPGFHIHPIKGFDYLPGDRTVWSRSDKDEPGGHGGLLIKLGTVAVKDRVSRHFMRGAGHACQFLLPLEASSDYELLRHLTSEERVLSGGKWVWKPRSEKRANHYWDALVYGVAAQICLASTLKQRVARKPPQQRTTPAQEPSIMSY